MTEGDNVLVKLVKVTKQKITGTFEAKTPKTPLDVRERQVEKLWQSIEEEAEKDIEATRKRSAKTEIDHEKLRALGDANEDEVEMQYRDLKELEDDEMETV